MSQKPQKKKSPAAALTVRTSSAGAARAMSVPATLAPVVDELEPQTEPGAVPVWLFVLLIVLVYWGMLHLDHYAGGFNQFVYGPYESYNELAQLQPKSGPEMLIARGAAVYQVNCSPCHQPTGMGNPGQAPPLAGSEWVLGTPNRPIRIANNGLTGPITIKGQAWNATMLPMGAAFSDEDLAAVLSFIRNSFGNSAPPVTPAQVKAAREQIGSRPRDGSASWTSDELLKVQ